jgi:histidinol-phosphate aminotransferase
MPAMRVAIETHQPAVIFLASPNNPTGGLFQRQDIEEILKLAPGLVVVDEAYQPFIRDQGDNFMSSLMNYPDLIVMRTLSKVGLASLRLGLIAGHEAWLTELDKLRLPYNINSLSQCTASFALDHWSGYQQQINEICSERDRVFQALSSRDEVEAWHSDTNFILFRLKKHSAVSIHAGLLKRNILIKCLHGASEQLENCLRVTVGSNKENTYFLEQLILLFKGN